jgi:hypothetical protein
LLLVGEEEGAVVGVVMDEVVGLIEEVGDDLGVREGVTEGADVREGMTFNGFVDCWQPASTQSKGNPRQNNLHRTFRGFTSSSLST